MEIAAVLCVSVGKNSLFGVGGGLRVFVCLFLCVCVCRVRVERACARAFAGAGGCGWCRWVAMGEWVGVSGVILR